MKLTIKDLNGTGLIYHLVAVSQHHGIKTENQKKKKKSLLNNNKAVS